MSLVAYYGSSDEESGAEDSVAINQKECTNRSIVDTSENNSSDSNLSKPLELSELSNNSKGEEYGESNTTPSLFNKLPAPKIVNALDIQEDDDEFLHKKATPILAEKRLKGPVQITIPSLSEFRDVDKQNDKSKTRLTQNSKGAKSCGLLDLLPNPKEILIKTTSSPSTTTNSSGSKGSCNKAKLIPDSVKKSQSTQKLQVATISKKKPQNLLESEENDSEDSDGEVDFFSLNTANDKLPDVSLNEINAMVAKRVIKMAETSAKLDKTLNTPAVVQVETNVSIEPNTTEINVDEKALHILVGSRAKRRKMEEVNVVELSSAEVLPNKDEWLRTAIASSTQYQPTGVLADEEPAPGTRKKHQITYLAHQAKANELELQAMWAANRHSRRQTQSKYGF